MLHILAAFIVGAQGGQPFNWNGGTNFRTDGLDPDTVACTLRLENDGTGSANATTGSFTSWWAGAPSTGIGTGKYFRATRTAGTALDFLTEGVWYELNTVRVIGVEQVGFGSHTWTGYFEFSHDGSTVAYTGPSFTLLANVDI